MGLYATAQSRALRLTVCDDKLLKYGRSRCVTHTRQIGRGQSALCDCIDGRWCFLGPILAPLSWLLVVHRAAFVFVLASVPSVTDGFSFTPSLFLHLCEPFGLF